MSERSPYRPAKPPLSLTKAEYEAQTQQSPHSPLQTSFVEPESVLASRSPAPLSEPRFAALRLPSPSAPRTSDSAIFSSAILMAAHFSPKQREF